uniref:Dipeptidylpeptidase IV N-terminal domain-containing protein n=1 Tax=Ciona savignyi TaxID=51511 RepID=H2YFY1_CIOSA
MVKRLIIFCATCLIGCFIATVLFVSSPSKRISSKSYKDQKLDEKKNPEKKWMEFDNFLDGTFRANSFYPRWVSGEEYVYKTNAGAINRVNISSGVDEEIFGSDAWANNPSGPFAWSLSPDQLYITISYNQIDGYAHYVRTFSCDIYEVSTGNKVGHDIPTQGIQKLQWSTSGHDLSYVYGFNVYIYKNTFNDNIQVTSDGDEQLVFNGISDWLFSVEITDDDSLMWWSPDSRYM